MNYKKYSIKNQILLVEDDSKLRELLKELLENKGYLVFDSGNIKKAKEILKAKSIDIILLDIMLPDMNGFDFIKELRKRSNISIIVLTARDTKEDMIQGLSLGADNYLIKPFEPEELFSQIKKILNKPQPQTIPLNLNNSPPFFNSKVYLTSSELTILNCLSKDIKKPVSRENLAKSLGPKISERSIDVQINRLRKKLKDTNHRIIRTIRHLGYALFP